MATRDELEAIFRRDLEVTGRVWGPFVLRRALGRGAAAAVFEASHSRRHVTVALKVLRPQVAADTNELARFLQEADLMAAAEHPNIVKLIEVGQVEHLHFYAMELVPGRDLNDVLEHGGRPPIDWTVWTLAAVAGAVVRLHAADVLHRDLKPANVLIEAETNRPVLTDLGIAKQLGADPQRSASGRLGKPTDALRALVGAPHTAKRRILGTPAYMAPEQVDTEASGGPTTSSDVYGFGAILYHALTGVPPFEAEDVVALLQKVQRDEPLPVRDLRASVPLALDALVRACLAKSPAARPADMKTVQARLLAIAARLPASPPTATFGAPWRDPDLAAPPAPGRFAVEDELGEDPTGVLSLATGPGGPVVLKVGDDAALEAEADALRALRDHPAFAPLREVGEDGGRGFLALERPAGPQLHELLASGAAPKGDLALALIRRLARALADAAARGLEHPDLQPTRVWLSEAGDPTVVGLVLIDGPARAWRGRRPGARALLELAFELATGLHPARAPAGALKAAWPDVPPEVERLLALAPGEEPGLTELAATLEEVERRRRLGITGRLRRLFGGS